MLKNDYTTEYHSYVVSEPRASDYVHVWRS